MGTPFHLTTKELVVRETYAPSGAQVFQLTSCPAINDHIYCEVPYMDAASRYVIYWRKHDSVGPARLWRADLEQSLVSVITEPLHELRGFAVSPDQHTFFCSHRLDKQTTQILRIDIATLEQRRWTFDDGGPALRTMGSVTPDLRYYIGSAYLGNKRFGILRFDLEHGTRELIYEQGHEMCNAHPQIDPGGGVDMMIQHNRDSIVDEHGRMIRPFGEIGKTIYLIDIEGKTRRSLPWGKPYTWPTQGHQCWIGKTGGIRSTVSGAPHDQLVQEGNLLALWPGAERPEVVGRGYYYSHPNASRDGRYWVSDERPGARIVVGSFETGRTAVLCESGSSFFSPQYTHPHPYYSPDKRWVIYNSDRTGIPHVYAARVPDGLLESLVQS
jgi:oligogalacturonide lyase